MEYLAKVNAARAELALLPDHDKTRSFDEVAWLVQSLPAALDPATPDQVKQLLAMLVGRLPARMPVRRHSRVRTCFGRGSATRRRALPVSARGGGS